MAELSVALVILGPLGLLVFLALSLLRMGMKASEMTDAARQRLSGCGVMLLYAATLGLIVAFIAGLFWMPHVIHYVPR